MRPSRAVTASRASTLGRRRAISGIRAATSYASRNQPEREAINMQIQGSAADLIKAAMLKAAQKRVEGFVGHGPYYDSTGRSFVICDW